MVVFTDPVAEDEGDLDSLLDGNYGARTLEENEQIHYSDRYRLNSLKRPTAQLSTLNSRKKLTATKVRLLAKKLSKEDIRKYVRFETLATTLCDQQDALDEGQRRYDAHLQSSSAQIAQLTRSHEARLEHEVRQAKGTGRYRDRTRSNE